MYNPRNEGGVRRMRADLNLAQKLLNYQPITPLNLGLRQYPGAGSARPVRNKKEEGACIIASALPVFLLSLTAGFEDKRIGVPVKGYSLRKVFSR